MQQIPRTVIHIELTKGMLVVGKHKKDTVYGEVIGVFTDVNKNRQVNIKRTANSSSTARYENTKPYYLQHGDAIRDIKTGAVYYLHELKHYRKWNRAMLVFSHQNPHKGKIAEKDCFPLLDAAMDLEKQGYTTIK